MTTNDRVEKIIEEIKFHRRSLDNLLRSKSETEMILQELEKKQTILKSESLKLKTEKKKLLDNKIAELRPVNKVLEPFLLARHMKKKMTL